MSELRFTATVDLAGRIKLDEPEMSALSLRELAGRRVSVVVKRRVNTRSLEQNRLLWGQVYAEAVANGTDFLEVSTGLPVFRSRDDVHGFAKLNLLKRPVMTNRGEIDLLGTTTTLSTAQFSEYIERLCALLAQYGVYIPPVGE